MKKMANVSGNKVIKAKIIDDSKPIIANIVQNADPIKSNVTTYSSATIDKKGIIRIATDEEALDGTNESIAITPHTLKLATHYTHIQGVASDTWVINHNLNKKPSITIVDSSGNVVEGAEKYIDENTVEIYFNGAFKGEAYLN